MKTEFLFAHTLKDLLSKGVLFDDISVQLLCKKCKCNRQTFYYHFHDLFDLLSLVYLNEKIANIDFVTNTNELIEAIYGYYKKHENFVKQSASSAGKDFLIEFLDHNCFKVLYKIICGINSSNNLTPNKKKNIARFYASSISNQIVFYIDNTKNITKEGMLALFAHLPNNYLNEAIATSIAASKKGK